MDGEFRTKAEERAYLTKIIKEWNDSRLDMFALSMPDKDLEFHGVVRFYFQGSDNKVVTKCIRVSSKMIVADLMDILIEKFGPDLKMLSHSNYELFECHEKGDTRKLGKSERPLLVQLSWHRDDREGRFLLKSASAKVASTFYQLGSEDVQFKRRLSRREKKELKKLRKRQEELRAKEKGRDDAAIAQQLYDEKPESSLTRSISNPEAVMKRRRMQKIQKRLKEFQADDGQQRGGTLKIFAETLKPEIPYKTILASIHQTSDKIVQDALEKFQLENENPAEYCLVMTEIPPGENPGPGRESAVKDHDCPLAIQSSWPATRGFLTFHLRKKNTVAGFKKETKPPAGKAKDTQADTKAAARLAHQSESDGEEMLPFLTEIPPEDSTSNLKPRLLKLYPNLTIIGSSKVPTSEQYIQLYAPDILPEHCFIENVDGEVTITPTNAEALILVNERTVYETTPLSSGAMILFGNSLLFQFNDKKGHRSTPTEQKQLASRVKSPMEPAVNDKSMSPVMREERPPFSIKELALDDMPGSRVDDDLTVETTFGVDGEIASSPVRKTDPNDGFPSSPLEGEQYQQQLSPGGQMIDNRLPLLPASLEFIDDAQDAFFAAIISEVNGAAVHFKLAPAYSLYLACHYMISPDFRPELGGVEHARVVGSTTRKMGINIEKTVQENDAFAGSLAFWMANASEFLHFLKQDMELSPLTKNAQGILAQSVQHAFRSLVLAMEDQLGLAMTAFLDPSEYSDIPENELDHILDDDLLERAESSDLLNWTSDERTFPVHDGRPITGEHWVSPAARINLHGSPVMADVLYILSSAMSLLRRCRVNAALTIQLFSQLFHFINMWLFNKLVLEPQLGLCTRAWGKRLRRRLGYVEAWAEKQGLELAADCHLCRIVQAAHLLDAPKISAEDIASISSTCFKLNSVQLRALLEMYRPDRGEHVIPPELIDNVVTVAEHTADELARNDGREVQLGEDEELQLPFLLPEDGYSCDIIRGVPAGLKEFLQFETDICRLTVNPTSSGLWTVHQEYYDGDDEGQFLGQYEEQKEEEDAEPKVIEVTLHKGNKGLGLSIVAAKGPHMEHLGIYIKGVVEGGTAYQNGQLAPSDQILSVNGMSLVEVSQETAAKLMGQAGPTVVLEIAKQAAVYHGLAALLSQPSPANSPAPFSKPEPAPQRDAYEGRPTIDEYSPQIRTQSWIANQGNSYGNDDYDQEQEEEKRRREEEEFYQEEENRRQEEAIKKKEEEEEERRIIEEQHQEKLRKIEQDRKKREEQERIRKEQEEEQRRLLEEQREKERLEELKRAEELAAEQRRIAEEKEKRRFEEERREEERKREEQRRRLEEEERKRIEEDRKRAEERKKFEQRQREYEARLRIMEEQQRKREREMAKQEEERRMEEERRKREELEELERLEKERKIQEEARKRKMEEEEERKQQEQEERRRLEEEERRKQEENRWRRQEEEHRRREEMRLEEEVLKREEERARRSEEESMRSQKSFSPNNREGSADDFDDFDDLPPPPEDLLLEEFGAQGEDEDKLEQRIQNQLAEERRQLRQAEHEQNELKRTYIENYEETNIDDVNDEELEMRLRAERSQARVAGGNSHSFYSSDEDPYEIELEFQRRLQRENERVQRERRNDFYTDDAESQKKRIEREQRAEQERKLQLMIDDHERRTANRNSDRKNIENISLDEQQKRLERLSLSGNGQSNIKSEDDWFAMQKKNHMQQRREQERIRKEQQELEEKERQRRLRDVRTQKEQEQKMMEEYRRQKDLVGQGGVAKKPWERTEVSYQRKENNDERVKDEFKEKALADYERRRATLDKDIERAEREKRIRSIDVKPPQVAKKPSTGLPKDEDEEPPPRPPPPSSISPVDILRSSSSTSPSPQPARGDRFSFSQKTISNVSAHNSSRQNPKSPPSRLYSPTNAYQPRAMSNSKSPSRDDPAGLDFTQKMKMFGAPQKTAMTYDMRSTFSKKQREYMD